MTRSAEGLVGTFGTVGAVIVAGVGAGVMGSSVGVIFLGAFTGVPVIDRALRLSSSLLSSPSGEAAPAAPQPTAPKLLAECVVPGLDGKVQRWSLLEVQGSHILTATSAQGQQVFELSPEQAAGVFQKMTSEQFTSEQLQVLQAQQITETLLEGDVVTLNGPDGSIICIGEIDDAILGAIVLDSTGRPLVVGSVACPEDADALGGPIQALLEEGYQPVGQPLKVRSQPANEIKPFARKAAPVAA